MLNKVLMYFCFQLNMCSSPPMPSMNRFSTPIRPFIIDQSSRGRNEPSQYNIQQTARPGGMYRFGNSGKKFHFKYSLNSNALK